MKANPTLNREATPRASSPAAGADPVVAARRRMILAKSAFSKAAVAALRGEPDATAKCSAALREVDAARDALRKAELTRLVYQHDQERAT